jgi:hypothetical protein
VTVGRRQPGVMIDCPRLTCDRAVITIDTHPARAPRP